MKIYKIIGCLFFISSCFLLKENNVYENYPKGSFLSKTLLCNAEQIILTNDELILLVDISESWNIEEPHLLFFNRDLRLYSASFLPSGRVENVDDNKISFTKSKELQNRAYLFTEDWPAKYKKVHVLEKPIPSKLGRISNKLIDGIRLNRDSKTVTVYFYKSKKNFFKVSDWEEANINLDTLSKDSIQLPLVHTYFDCKEKKIIVTYTDASGRFISDYFSFIDKATIDNFYEELIQSLSSSPN